MPESPLARRSARPVDTKADQIVQRVGVAIALEDRQRIAGDGPIMAGTLEGRFDRTVLLHQPDRPLEIALLDLVVAQRSLPEIALKFSPAPEAEDHGEGDLALAKVVADGFAEMAAVAGIIEHIVDQLEGDAEIAAIGFERAIASFSATIAFALAYYLGSSRFPRYSALAGSLIGLAVFITVAVVLSMIPFSLASATALTLCTIGGAGWLGRDIYAAG